MMFGSAWQSPWQPVTRMFTWSRSPAWAKAASRAAITLSEPRARPHVPAETVSTGRGSLFSRWTSAARADRRSFTVMIRAEDSMVASLVPVLLDYAFDLADRCLGGIGGGH